MAPSIISTSPPSSPTPYPSNPVERVGLNEEYEADENTIEPIAVVGLSLKFPDDATSPESFWNLLMEKRCASREIPSDRANLEAFYHSDGTRPDAVSSKLLWCSSHNFLPYLLHSSTFEVDILSVKTWERSMPRSSRYHRQKPCRWILSIVTSWKLPTEHWKMVSNVLLVSCLYPKCPSSA